MPLHLVRLMKIYALPTLALLTVCWIVPAHAENLSHTQQLISTKQCERCDLSSAGLIYANLVGANLNGANLAAANLSRSNLSGANLSGANLAGAALNGANLTGANLSQANLTGVDLREANLTGVNMEGAITEGANFLGAIGLPQQVATPQNLYMLGLQEDQRGNYRGAIDYYTRAIDLQPDFATAFLARGVTRLRLRDQAGALQDAEAAERFYLAQGDEQGHQRAVFLAEGVQAIDEAQAKADRASQGGGGSGGNILGVLSGIANLALQIAPMFLVP